MRDCGTGYYPLNYGAQIQEDDELWSGMEWTPGAGRIGTTVRATTNGIELWRRRMNAEAGTEAQRQRDRHKTT